MLNDKRPLLVLLVESEGRRGGEKGLEGGAGVEDKRKGGGGGELECPRISLQINEDEISGESGCNRGRGSITRWVFLGLVGLVRNEGYLF